MKMKKLLPILVTAVIGATALSGCTAGDTKLEFKNNWLKSPISPQESLTETLGYNVTFEKDSGYDTLAYQFDYQNGAYVTTLTQRSDGTFEYTTKLTIDVTYTLGEKSETKQDVVETYVYFENASNGLTPIKSTKTILSHTPNNATKPLSDLKDCYKISNYSIETTYTDGNGVCILQNLIVADGADKLDAPETYNFEMGKKLSYLDNEQLLLGLRAFDLSTSSGKINTYSPFTPNAKQKISVSFKSDKTSAPLNVKENGQLFEGKHFEYRTATMKLNAANSGAEQTAWVATENRCVILRLETPLPFNFGKLVYAIKTIDRVEA